MPRVQVKADLLEMSKCFPAWKNVNEMLLALRECNYDLQDTLVFVDINYNFGGEGGPEGGAAGGTGRTPFGRRATGERPETPTGSMSVAAATRIDELERQVWRGPPVGWRQMSVLACVLGGNITGSRHIGQMMPPPHTYPGVNLTRSTTGS